MIHILMAGQIVAAQKYQEQIVVMVKTLDCHNKFILLEMLFPVYHQRIMTFFLSQPLVGLIVDLEVMDSAIGFTIHNLTPINDVSLQHFIKECLQKESVKKHRLC